MPAGNGDSGHNGVSFEFDHWASAFAQDPFPVYETMRKTCPFAHSDAHGGFWVATRYGDIRSLALAPERFSSRCIVIPSDVGFGDTVLPPLQMDPPAHTRLKRLLTPAFTPPKAAEFEPSTRRFVGELLDGLVPGGAFDAAHDFARLVPTFLVCQVIGLPDELETFAGWVACILEHGVDNFEQAAAAGMEMLLYLSDVVAKRAADPGPDLASFLVQTEIDGDRLDPGEITCTLLLLFLAGIETTWRFLSASIHHLAIETDQQQLLRERPELQATAIEELLRAFAPVSVTRVTVGDVEFAGQQLLDGDRILLPLGSANRDEDMFPDAQEVQLDRQPNAHLTFGSGVHRCLGANLARMEIGVALGELLRRVPPFRLADPDDVVWATGPVRGPNRVKIVF